MDMPKPSGGHKLLERLAGIWEGEETMYPSRWDPKGGKATGRNKHVMSLSGFALLSDYEQERKGAVTFSGHGVYTYNPKEDLYYLHWFDCMGSPPEVFFGKFEKDVLTIAHGGPMHARFTYDMSKDGEMKSRMEMSEDGKDWKVFFDAVYKRK